MYKHLCTTPACTGAQMSGSRRCQATLRPPPQGYVGEGPSLVCSSPPKRVQLLMQKPSITQYMLLFLQFWYMRLCRIFIINKSTQYSGRLGPKAILLMAFGIRNLKYLGYLEPLGLSWGIYARPWVRIVLRVCISVHFSTCTCIYIYTCSMWIAVYYVYIHMYLQMFTCTHTYLHVYMHIVCIYIYTHVFIQLYVHAHIFSRYLLYITVILMAYKKSCSSSACGHGLIACFSGRFQRSNI